MPVKILSCVFEVFLSAWFFRSEYRETESVGRKAGSVLILFALAPLVLLQNLLGSMSVRFGYRMLVLFLALFFLNREKPQRCLYLASLCALAFAAQQNLLTLSRSLTHGIIDNEVFRFLVVLLMEYLLPFVILSLVSNSIDFARVSAFSGHQLVMLGLLIPCVLFVKRSFFVLTTNQPRSLPLTSALYPLIISTLILFLIAYYDRFWQLRNDREEQQLLSIAQQQQYKNLQMQIAAQEENRAVIHDIRNHLLALASTGTQTQKKHIEELLESIDQASVTADTGNATLDAILLQKQRDAAALQIRMIADLDLRKAAPIGPKDTISIFASALDNAVEAAAEVPEEEDRYIHLRGGQVANFYIVRITNSCARKAELRDDGLLQTQKADAEHHGVGLRSMRRALDKLGGTLSFEQKDDCFILTLSLPQN